MSGSTTPAQGPQFREVRPVVGSFVLITLLALITLVFLTARAQRWFGRFVAIELLLPEDGSFGLRRGSSVEMLGSTVGTVDDLWIDDQTDRMHARLSIQGPFFRFVRVDSAWIIKRKTFGLTGDAYIEITRGTGTPAEAGARFDAAPDREPTQLLQDISAELMPTLKAAREVIQSHSVLAQGLADPAGSLQQILQRADRLTQALERGEGLAGRLLVDGEWARTTGDALKSAAATVERARTAIDELVAIIKAVATDASSVAANADGLITSTRVSIDRMPALLDDVQGVLARVRAALDDLASFTAVLPELATTVRGEARNLTGVVAQARGALAEIDRLVLAVQAHWLISGYVAPTPGPGRMAPGEAGGSGAVRR